MFFRNRIDQLESEGKDLQCQSSVFETKSRLAQADATVLKIAAAESDSEKEKLSKEYSDNVVAAGEALVKALIDCDAAETARTSLGR